MARPTILPDRPMTGAERVRRHRYMRGWIDMQLNRMLKRRKPAVQHNWNRTAPPDMLGNELAWAMFDFATRKANRERWYRITAAVEECMDRLEREFPPFRYEFGDASDSP